MNYEIDLVSAWKINVELDYRKGEISKQQYERYKEVKVETIRRYIKQWTKSLTI